MRSLFSKTLFKIILMITALCTIFVIGKINATIPNDYIANYEISQDYNTILWLFVEIDAATKIGNQIPQSKFLQLNTSFQTVFPKFPQDYAFKVTYQQCLSASQGLVTYTSTDYQTKLSSFMTNCYNSCRWQYRWLRRGSRYKSWEAGCCNPYGYSDYPCRRAGVYGIRRGMYLK